MERHLQDVASQRALLPQWDVASDGGGGDEGEEAGSTLPGEDSAWERRFTSLEMLKAAPKKAEAPSTDNRMLLSTLQVEVCTAMPTGDAITQRNSQRATPIDTSQLANALSCSPRLRGIAPTFRSTNI